MVTLRQLSGGSSSLSNITRVPHPSLDKGMMRDFVPYEIPEGGSYTASDFICDVIGKIRKRGGWTTISSSNLTAKTENIVAYRSAGFDGGAAVYGSGGTVTGNVYQFDLTTGAINTVAGSSAGGAPTNAYQPFQYGNFVVFPFQSTGAVSSGNTLLYAGGGTGANVAPTGGTVTAGDNRITGITGATMAATHVGSFIQLVGTGNNVYMGRIVGFITSASVRVEPTPTTGFTIGSGFVKSIMSGLDAGFSLQVTGRYGLAYQGRIVFASTLQVATADVATKGLDIKRTRVQWSQLQSEAIPEVFASPVVQDGNPILYGSSAFYGDNTNPYFNYTDIPEIGVITGLAAIGDGELVVFGPRSMFRISGQLTTNTEEDANLLYTVDRVSNNVGIPEANPVIQGDDPSRSIQYTPQGVIFAANDNIYLYDGSSLKGLLTGTNQRYYQGRRLLGSPIFGSCYIPQSQHYLLSMGVATGTGSIMINLTTYAVTLATNTLFFGSCVDPTASQITYAACWWNTSGAAPILTKGQLARLDGMFAATGNKQDGNSTDVIPVLITKPYVDGALEAMKLFRQLYVDYDLRSTTSPNLIVTAHTDLNPLDTGFVTLTQGTLPKGTHVLRAALDVTNQLARGKALCLQMTLDGAADSLDIFGVNIAFEPEPLT